MTANSTGLRYSDPVLGCFATRGLKQGDNVQLGQHHKRNDNVECTHASHVEPVSRPPSY